jgi:hypothetical protein
VTDESTREKEDAFDDEKQEEEKEEAIFSDLASIQLDILYVNSIYRLNPFVTYPTQTLPNYTPELPDINCYP